MGSITGKSTCVIMWVITLNIISVPVPLNNICIVLRSDMPVVSGVHVTYKSSLPGLTDNVAFIAISPLSTARIYVF